MSNLTKTNDIKSLLSNSEVSAKFSEILGKRATQFTTSIIQITNSNELLKKSTPQSIINAAMTAAILDLPLNNNLGFAYIVPFNEKQKDGSYKTKAQFQLGYKGYIQLAQRSGQFKTISSTPIYEGQIISENPLTGFEFDFSKKTSDKIIGFAAYFELLNGFSKTLYMTKEQLMSHGVKFSQTFKRGFGLWKDDFESMANKTVLKLLLSKFAPLSVEMQRAIISDSAVINDADTVDVSYVDNSTMSIDDINDDKEKKRLVKFIENCNNVDDLKNIPDDSIKMYNLEELIKQKEDGFKN